ncbi:MAG TPA: beta-ketoacyl synthase N-terminal-like domain-containing protein, partial [bacterium]|nr:beta-ketoacyl synthase N-terminal-like domain-containing protein [bacterium]
MREGRRVVITGLGLVTPLGTGVEKTWSGLLAGRSGIGPITQFDVSAFPTRISGTVPDFVAPEFLDRKEIRRLDRFVQYALIAAAEAMNDAGLSREKIDPARTGVIVGSGIGGLRVMEQEHRNL